MATSATTLRCAFGLVTIGRGKPAPGREFDRHALARPPWALEKLRTDGTEYVRSRPEADFMTRLRALLPPSSMGSVCLCVVEAYLDEQTRRCQGSVCSVVNG